MPQPDSPAPRGWQRRLRRALGSAAVRLARRHPHGHRMSALVLLASGYLVLAAPALVAVWALSSLISAIGTGSAGAALGAVAVAGACAALAFAWWRRAPAPPAGLELTATAAPGLFRMLDGLREHYPRPLTRRAPHIHRVLVTPLPELRLVQTPLWGFPVRFQTTLLIGLPRMQTLKPIQLQALLAGRIGMLSGRSGVALSLIRRLHDLWGLYAQADWVHSTPARWLLRACFKPLAASSAVWSAPALRQHALEADHCALEAVNYDDVIEAVLADAIAGRFLKDKFWPAVERLGQAAARPRRLPFASLETAYSATTEAERRQWLERALRSPSGRARPSLTERLQNLHMSARLPTAPEQTAARHYLGDSVQHVVQSLDRQWLADNLRRWRRRDTRRVRAQRELEILRREAAQRRLTDAELQRFISLVNRYLGRAAASRLFRSALEWDRGDARLQLAVGRQLVDLGDPEGIPALERAMDLNEALAVPACRLISRARQNAKVA